MLTGVEMERLVQEVNKAFEADRKRMDKLEERINAIEERPKTGTSRGKRVQQTEGQIQ